MLCKAQVDLDSISAIDIAMSYDFPDILKTSFRFFPYVSYVLYDLYNTPRTFPTATCAQSAACKFADSFRSCDALTDYTSGDAAYNRVLHLCE